MNIVKIVKNEIVVPDFCGKTMKLSDVQVQHEKRTFEVTVKAPEIAEHKKETHIFTLCTYRMFNPEGRPITAESDGLGHIGNFSKILECVDSTAPNAKWYYSTGKHVWEGGQYANTFDLNTMPLQIHFQNRLFHQANYSWYDEYTIDLELLDGGKPIDEVENILGFQKEGEGFDLEMVPSWYCRYDYTIGIKLIKFEKNIEKHDTDFRELLRRYYVPSGRIYKIAVPSHYLITKIDEEIPDLFE